MSKMLGSVMRRFGVHRSPAREGTCADADPFPDYAVSPPGASGRAAGAVPVCAQEGCVQEDGSIIMEPGYINTARIGDNCQQQQIAEFIASVRTNSPSKMPGLKAPKSRSPKGREWLAHASGRQPQPEGLHVPVAEKPVVHGGRDERDALPGAHSAGIGTSPREVGQAHLDHSRCGQWSAGVSQLLLEDELSQAETAARTAETSRSRACSEAVPGDETGGESEGEAFFDDVVSYHIAGLAADDDLDEADEYDDVIDVPLEPALPAPAGSVGSCAAAYAPPDPAAADVQKTVGVSRRVQAAATGRNGGSDWKLSPAASRAQEECLGTSQAMLDAKFALEYGAGLQEG